MKAQSLPMNALVLGALALLVLIALTTMWVTGGGNIFSGFAQIVGSATPSTLSQAKLACKSYCADLQKLELTYEQVQDHKFCAKTFDLSKEGGGTKDRCFDLNSIGEECSFTGSDGSAHTIVLHTDFACDSQLVMSSWQ